MQISIVKNQGLKSSFSLACTCSIVSSCNLL